MGAGGPKRELLAGTGQKRDKKGIHQAHDFQLCFVSNGEPQSLLIQKVRIRGTLMRLN